MITEQLKQEIRQYLIANPINRNQPNCYKPVADLFNVDAEVIRGLYRRLREKGLITEPLSFTAASVKYYQVIDTKNINNPTISTTASTNQILEKSFDTTKGEGKITASLLKEPQTDEEIIKLLKIDTSKYILNHYWSKWNGKTWSVSAFIKLKTVSNSLDKQKDIILKELSNIGDKAFEKTTALFLQSSLENSDNCLLEISIPDIHIGKLSHKDETGEDYDIKIAVSRYKNAIRDILQNVNLSKVSRILLPIGNDLLHVNSEDNMTVAGTPQDCDSRFHKMVKATKNLLIETIAGLSQIAPVDVVVIKGNHDSTATFMLGEILDAYFTNNKRVTIDNSPSWRKYYQFGKVGFIYTHGDKEKHSDLGLIFATEKPELWAETKFRFAKLGHLHKSKTTQHISVDTNIGFQVQILPSLSATDEWHSSKGYLGLKQAKGFLYHPLKGEIAQYTYTV